jgi:excisionase family DNA binding protein
MSGRKKVDGLFLDVIGVAELLGHSSRAIRALVSRRRIPFRRQGARILFVRREIEEWIDSLPGLSLQELRSAGESK